MKQPEAPQPVRPVHATGQTGSGGGGGITSHVSNPYGYVNHIFKRP
jgi:hypothetical protein